MLAACLSLAASVAGLAPLASDNARWSARQTALSLTAGQFVFAGIAFVALVWSFAVDDFSVSYVANHSNSLLPWYYKISATWGGHEGSFLLWIVIMSVWMLLFALRQNAYPQEFSRKVLGILALLNLGFICFALFSSNPFLRLIPMTPADGADLNPLLQDFGLIVHPPLLYAGYVGLAMPFAFAVAALLEGRIDAAWARWARTWTNMAWAFLTVGIALGSWWAYYEL
ncbi:MAG TPA: heme lyase NrfEFG subunit NrfE, partial [Gammaproteobacteria bacterium]|nr:heme lyase NrfEFG subunit NrfE [Gammaproteobacteria bacterium]